MRLQLADMSGQRATLQTQLASMTRLKDEADAAITKLSKTLRAATGLADDRGADAAQNQAKILTENSVPRRRRLKI